MTSFPHDWAEDARRPAVVAALDSLSDLDRTLLILHHVDGMPIDELADVIGKSVRAIESALARARRRFRLRYDEGVGAVRRRARSPPRTGRRTEGVPGGREAGAP